MAAELANRFCFLFLDLYWFSSHCVWIVQSDGHIIMLICMHVRNQGVYWRTSDGQVTKIKPNIWTSAHKAQQTYIILTKQVPNISDQHIRLTNKAQHIILTDKCPQSPTYHTSYWRTSVHKAILTDNTDKCPQSPTYQTDGLTDKCPHRLSPPYQTDGQVPTKPNISDWRTSAHKAQTDGPLTDHKAQHIGLTDVSTKPNISDWRTSAHKAQHNYQTGQVSTKAKPNISDWRKAQNIGLTQSPLCPQTNISDWRTASDKFPKALNLHYSQYRGKAACCLQLGSTARL